MTTTALPLDLRRIGFHRLRPFLRDFGINGENGRKPPRRPERSRGAFSLRSAGCSWKKGPSTPLRSGRYDGGAVGSIQPEGRGCSGFRRFEHAEPVLAADLGDVRRRGDPLQRRQDLAVAAGVARYAAAAAGHVEADADMFGADQL